MWYIITNIETGAHDVIAEDVEVPSGWIVECSTANPNANALNQPVYVPGAVTMRQARLALLEAGKLSMIPVIIESLPSPMKEAAMIEWEYSSEVLRHNGFVAQIGPALSMSSAQIDALFIRAAQL